MWKDLFLPNRIGSEDGLVLRDEEYDDACRVTLERCPDHYAVTFGIYGAMAQTAFCGEEDHDDVYEAIKKELEDFFNRKTTPEEDLAFYEHLVDTYY
ncbi:MAG: hypothetical protein KIG36_04105 [Eubacteriales bacterium]|nr:hypothetical protein [Eubacteriales bacterium]